RGKIGSIAAAYIYYFEPVHSNIVGVDFNDFALFLPVDGGQVFSQKDNAFVDDNIEFFVNPTFYQNRIAIQCEADALLNAFCLAGIADRDGFGTNIKGGQKQQNQRKIKNDFFQDFENCVFQ